MEKENKLSPANQPDTREMYTTPLIEVIGVSVERGFMGSGDESDTLDPPGGPGGW